MPSRSLMSSLAAVALAAATTVIAAPAAQAQGLIDFLWGGSKEWGGSKQTVSFDQRYTPGQIIVSFGDRRLYLITKPGQAVSYPIAVPREQSRWQGTTTVTSKRENPSWRPTPDMLKENPRLPSWVPGGHPMNPLGVRALYLGSSLYRIHGTDAPWTIGQAVSKGCIRMFNEDVLDLYPRVATGTKVTVTWERFGSKAVASNDDAPPVRRASYSRYSAPPRSIRQRTPSAEVEQVAVRALEEPERPQRKVEKSAAAKPQQAKPATKVGSPKVEAKAETAEPVKKPAPVKAAAKTEAATPDYSEAAAAAKKAAAAAKKAAEAARTAAEAARKAAEDAQRATGLQTDDERNASAPKASAAL